MDGGPPGAPGEDPMNSPVLLLVLLALPFVTGAVIVSVSAVRRRASDSGEPVHRLQADPADVQEAAVHPTSGRHRLTSGRARRAASSVTPDEH